MVFFLAKKKSGMFCIIFAINAWFLLFLILGEIKLNVNKSYCQRKENHFNCCLNLYCCWRYFNQRRQFENITQCIRFYNGDIETYTCLNLMFLFSLYVDNISFRTLAIKDQFDYSGMSIPQMRCKSKSFVISKQLWFKWFKIRLDKFKEVNSSKTSYVKVSGKKKRKWNSSCKKMLQITFSTLPPI